MSGTARLKATFYRGGTSKAVVFNGADLPPDMAARDAIFLHVLGSPDRYGRQLDGMGGGLSSLSKVVIVEPSARDDADVDYTFAQIAVDRPVVDYGSTCGNMASSVGPFAIDEGIVSVAPGTTEALIRIHNTNTGQVYHSTFAVDQGRSVEGGDFEIPGVSQTGAPVKLDFLDPGGSATGKLLPTGNAVDRLSVPNVGEIDASLVDAANPVVYVRAGDLRADATALPDRLDADAALVQRMDAIRRVGAVAMGMATTIADVALSSPKVALVAPPAPFVALDGQRYEPDTFDISIRLISMGNFHRAITLSGGMCAAVAARIPGTLVAGASGGQAERLRIGNPSGVLPVSADVGQSPAGPVARSASTYRTQRRIMEGAVLFPRSLLGPDA